MFDRTHLCRPLIRTVLAIGASSLTIVADPAAASGVHAGTTISNTASATFDSGGGAITTITSNTVTLKVDEVLDVTVTARDTSDATVGAGSSGQIRAFTVTNAGNGPEAFLLAGTGAVSGNGFDPAVTGVAIDTNGDGLYEAGVDQLVAGGGASTEIQPDAGITVFVISTIPTDAADGKRGHVRLDATAVTGSGTPGTVFGGKGSGGGDAIVGATHATAFATGGFLVARASVGLVKSQSVADIYGGSQPTPGATITYTLAATVSGSGSVAGLHLTDGIPDGTVYLPGSLTLDGVVLTDAADGDAGIAAASGIDVTLGTQTGGSHTVTFKVKIN